MSIQVTRVVQPLYGDGGILRLPEWCIKGLVNSHIPSEAELFTADAIQRYPLSTQLRKADNTIWRYVRAGAAHSAFGYMVGNYTQCPGKAGNSVASGYEGGLTGSIAANQEWIDIADTAATKNLYEQALLVIYDETNGFQQYRVIGNDAYDTYASGITRLWIGSPGFKAADAGAPGVTIYLSPFYDIRGVLGQAYMTCLGYLRMTVASGYYAWMQTAGEISGVTGAGTWPGQTANYRGVWRQNQTVGTLGTGFQRIGTLLGRTATDYGDNHFNLELDQ